MLSRGSRFYVRNGGVTGDLRDAVRPVIWHMGLEQSNPVAFSVEQSGGVWELGLRTHKGDRLVLAEYETREAAQAALRRLSCSLKQQGWGRRLLNLVLILVLGLLGYFLWQATRDVSSELRGMSAAQVTGQSLSADEGLRAPLPAK